MILLYLLAGLWTSPLVEVKISEWARDARSLKTFPDEYPDMTDGGPLTCTGGQILPLTRRVPAVPRWAVR